MLDAIGVGVLLPHVVINARCLTIVSGASQTTNIKE